MIKAAVICGTRPEAIKLSPLIHTLSEDDDFDCRVCVTAQHREMLDQVLNLFGIIPDVDLALMQPGQSLASLTAVGLQAVTPFLAEERPDVVIVQGDTTTVLAASLAAFYEKIPVAHVEAGLRTGNMHAPWPEEMNRVVVSRLASLHFAPTERNRQALLREGVLNTDIHVTGNTIIDALLLMRQQAAEIPPYIAGLPASLQPGYAEGDGPRMVLITAHRREHLDGGLQQICNAVETLADTHREVHFVYPVHMNPRVQKLVNGTLRKNKRSNVHLLEPLDYISFVALLDRCCIALTDSGGIQEEAPSLGKPVLVMRDSTERPEGVDAGTAKLVGTSTESIVSQVNLLLENDEVYASMASVQNPYGEGHAANSIMEILRSSFL